MKNRKIKLRRRHKSVSDWRPVTFSMWFDTLTMTFIMLGVSKYVKRRRVEIL